MSEFNLLSQSQRRLLRILVLLLPVVMFGPFLTAFELFFVILQGHLLEVNFSGLILWLVITLSYLLGLVTVLSGRILINNGILHYGFLGAKKVLLSSLIEVAGSEGSLADNFKESIILEFDDGREITVDLQDYEDDEIRAFLAALRIANPICPHTYSGVIPLESRGLLKFLVGTAHTDSLILELSKTPMEDMVLQLIKRNEKTFLSIYATVCLLVMAGLSFYRLESNNGNTEYLFHTGRSWKESQETSSLQAALLLLQNSPSADQLRLAQMRLVLISRTSLDYWASEGLEIIKVIWTVIGITVMAIPVLRLASPSFLFLDSRSFGMGRRFLLVDRVRKIELRKPSPMADPLDGTLELEGDSPANSNSLSIDLTRVPNLQQRHFLLRLVERYAINAQRSDEFLRATNALVDIQFTDLWLQSKESEALPDMETPDLVGRSLANGAYEVESILGYGGQGTTYLARSVRSDSDAKTRGFAPVVVVKETVLPSQADVRIMLESMERFQRGAKLLQELQNPQIVRLLDHFVEKGKAYLVMEYIKGHTLRQLIKESGQLSAGQVCSLGIQLCEILNYLHSRQPPVIHCDLAPDNLILTPEGKLKLVDFDVARVVDGEAQTLIAGRPSYTPPEQFRGKPIIQSDIFAAGAILHFLLKGKDPAPLGSGAETPSGQDAELEAVIAACLSFEAADRPCSALDVQTLLASLAEEQGKSLSVSSLEREEV